MRSGFVTIYPLNNEATHLGCTLSSLDMTAFDHRQTPRAGMSRADLPCRRVMHMAPVHPALHLDEAYQAANMPDHEHGWPCTSVPYLHNAC